MSANYIKDETITAKTDLANMSKKDLNFLLGENDVIKYTPAELKGKTQTALADELHTLLVSTAPKGKSKLATEKKERVFTPKDSKNVACAASAKTNLIKALIAGKKTIDQARAIIAGNPTLAAYWGETVEQDLTNALSGIRPQAVRAAAALDRKAAAALERANRPAKAPKTVVEVDLGPDAVETILVEELAVGEVIDQL